MGEHLGHKVGTVSDCKDCTAVAYEPSWYASLLAFGQNQYNTMIVLDTSPAVNAY